MQYKLLLVDVVRRDARYISKPQTFELNIRPVILVNEDWLFAALKVIDEMISPELGVISILLTSKFCPTYNFLLILAPPNVVKVPP